MTHPLVEAARKYEGVKFKHQGRRKDALDCGGLLVLSVYDAYSRVLKDISGYKRAPDISRLKHELDEQLTPVIGEPESGHVLLMKTDSMPQHIAIKTDIGIIHAAADHGKVVEHGLNDRLRKQIVAVYSVV